MKVWTSSIEVVGESRVTKSSNFLTMSTFGILKPTMCFDFVISCVGAHLDRLLGSLSPLNDVLSNLLASLENESLLAD